MYIVHAVLKQYNNFLLIDTSIGYLAKPHVHECVPGLPNLPHVQLSGSGGHAAWVGGVQSAQLVGKEDATLMILGEAHA